MRTVCVVIAVVLCLLAAFGVNPWQGLNLFPLGAAFGFLSLIVRE